jgi:hypothetical protein
MYEYIFLYMYVCMYVCIYIYIYIYIYTFSGPQEARSHGAQASSYVYVCVCIYIYLFGSARGKESWGPSLIICICVCVYIYIPFRVRKRQGVMGSKLTHTRIPSGRENIFLWGGVFWNILFPKKIAKIQTSAWDTFACSSCIYIYHFIWYCIYYA